MRIKRIRVQSLRAVKDCTLYLDSLTALVGPNGAGKSTFLHALMLFQGDVTACKDDYHNRDTTRDIDIQITFTNLPNAVTRTFPKYAHDDGLGVKCIIRWNDVKAASTLHGCIPGNPDFEDVLDASGEDDTLGRYVELLEKPQYSDFPKLTSAVKIVDYLEDWARNNPDKYNTRHDDKPLLGDAVDGAAYLKRYICFLYIPAVLDAAAGGNGDGDGSALGELLDAITRSAFAEKAKHEDPVTMLKSICAGIMRGESLSELDELKAGANNTLASLAPGSQVDLEWLPPSRDADMPRAEPRLVEDEYTSPVGMAGHGLQRAFVIMAALLRIPLMQNLDEIKDGAREGPSVVLAIEEPEIYQHPTRMRHLAGLFRSMSQDGLDGVADRIQVVYTTHSPHFVFADHIGQIRLVSKEGGKEGMPRTTRVEGTTSADILAELKRRNAAHAADGAIDHSLLRAMGPAASEGFFANAVVLTEGPSDRIALLGTAEVMGHSLDALGVSVISCGSKLAIPLPLVMFRRLGIPVYAVWDADKNEGSQRKESERIVSALGYGGTDWRGKTTGSFACLPNNLEDAIRSDLKNALGAVAGEDPYNAILDGRRKRYGLGQFSSKQMKTHLVMEEVREKGIRLERLESIVGEIAKLPGGSASK